MSKLKTLFWETFDNADKRSINTTATVYLTSWGRRQMFYYRELTRAGTKDFPHHQ